MDAHRIEILDRANDDHVANIIAQQLEFVLFPAHNAPLNQYLVYGGGVQTIVQRIVELFRRVHKSSSGSTKRIRGPDHEGKSDLLCDLFSHQERSSSSALAYADT